MNCRVRLARVTGRVRLPPYFPSTATVRGGETVMAGGTERRAFVRVGPTSLNGASHPASGTRLRRAANPETAADPAGLTATARPQGARRTSNLYKT